MQQHDVVSLERPASGLSLEYAFQEVAHAASVPQEATAHSGGLKVMDVNYTWEDGFSLMNPSSCADLVPKEPQHNHPLAHQILHPPLLKQEPSDLSSSVATPPHELSTHLTNIPHTLQQSDDPLPAENKHAAPPHLPNPSVSYAESQQNAFRSECPPRQQCVLPIQQDGVGVVSPQQHPVRYDSELNMWVVVVPSKGSRHVLFASKYCVRKRGFAEARRRALASYQRFLAQRYPKAALLGCAVGDEPCPGIVSHPSMFFSRAKEAWCTQWYEGTKRIFKSFSRRVHGELAEPLCRWFWDAVRRHGRRPSLIEVETQYAHLRSIAILKKQVTGTADCHEGVQLHQPSEGRLPARKDVSEAAPQGTMDTFHEAAAEYPQWPQHGSCQLRRSVSPTSSESAIVAASLPLQLHPNSKGEVSTAVHGMDGTHSAADVQPCCTVAASSPPGTPIHAAMDIAECQAASTQEGEDSPNVVAHHPLATANGNDRSSNL